MTIEEAKKIVTEWLSDEECSVTFQKCDAYEPSNDVFSIYSKEHKEAMEALCRDGLKVCFCMKGNDDMSKCILGENCVVNGNRNLKGSRCQKEGDDALDGENSKMGVSEEIPLECSKERLSETASQFNEAILDEQARIIREKDSLLENWERQYGKLEGQNMILKDKLEDLERVRKGKAAKVRELGKEIARLNGALHEKNELVKNLISDHGKVSRELHAEKALHEIDLQATKSAESALIYKEREYEKSLREKDEVIDDLSRELAHSKKREEELMATVKDYLVEIEGLRKERDAEEKTIKPADVTQKCAADKDGMVSERKKYVGRDTNAREKNEKFVNKNMRKCHKPCKEACDGGNSVGASFGKKKLNARFDELMDSFLNGFAGNGIGLTGGCKSRKDDMSEDMEEMAEEIFEQIKRHLW